jgi:predicted phage terminase large subunit-like protein
LITVPPRYLKSICGSVGFVAFCLGHDPSLKFLVASYGPQLAAEHAGNFRRILEADWYKSLFPGMRNEPRKDTEMEFITVEGGGRRALTLGGAITGLGGDILIVDDLMKTADAHSRIERERVKAYYQDSLVSRLNDKRTGRIIVIQQRLHQDDLAGFLIANGNFEHLNLTAIAERDESFDLPGGRRHRRSQGDALHEQREPLETLEHFRREMGPATFSAQYQQSPVSPGGNLIRLEWFPTYDAALERADYEYVVQSWDTAAGIGRHNDFSVCTTFGWHQRGWNLLDIYRGRLEYPDLRQMVLEQGRRWNANRAIIEYAGVGAALVQELLRDHPGIVGIRPRQNKEVRLVAQSGKIFDGVVRLPREAPWLDAFRDELRAFPNGEHDDQVDCLSQLLEWADPDYVEDLIDRLQHNGRSSGRRRPRGLSREERSSILRIRAVGWA